MDKCYLRRGIRRTSVFSHSYKSQYVQLIGSQHLAGDDVA